MSDRRMFSEKEAAEIVLRAAKLQEQSATGSASYAPGIDFESLKRMAEDVGVDEEFLLQAMRGAGPGDEKRQMFLGVPVATSFEKVIEGEVPQDQFDVVMEAFRGTQPGAAGQGVAFQVGRSVDGRISRGFAFGPISVTSRRGRTRITARQSCFVPFMSTLYPVLLFGFLGTVLLPTVGRMPLWMAGVLGAVLLAVGWALFGWACAKGEAKMRAIVEDLAARVSEEADLGGRQGDGLRTRAEQWSREPGADIAREPEQPDKA